MNSAALLRRAGTAAKLGKRRINSPAKKHARRAPQALSIKWLRHRRGFGTQPTSSAGSRHADTSKREML